jgi:hypothetical protein
MTQLTFEHVVGLEQARPATARFLVVRAETGEILFRSNRENVAQAFTKRNPSNLHIIDTQGAFQ